ncbi:hypothetical protein CJU89_5237 [Yarrowia sp. B02]|nr:hypothetical protein CJU89_5237 [Yarrowia sp. B02]
MTAILTSDQINSLRGRKEHQSLGSATFDEEVRKLQKSLLVLSRQTLQSLDDVDVESRDLPIYDRDSTISRLDRAATDIALAQGHVQAHVDAFDRVLNEVQIAGEGRQQWRREHADEEENGSAPEVPDLADLYETTVANLPEETRKSRASILKKSQGLKKHKETLLWELMPEIDLGDDDKWWLSLGSLVSKHVGSDKLDPNPNGLGLSDTDSEDELFVSRKSNLKCPITGDYLDNPVRAVVCKHLFSSDAFREWLLVNGGRSKCPVAGCNNNLRSMGDVENDESVVARVKRLKRNVERKQKERETLGTQRI